MDAPQVAIMRHLDNQYAFMEAQQPIGTERYDEGELRRVHAACRSEAIRTTVWYPAYIPPRCDVAVLLPCSARKPYSLSQSHRRFQMAVGDRAHELIVTSPLGLVPRDSKRFTRRPL